MDLPGIRSPHEFYVAASEPAPIAGMHKPDGKTPWAAIHAAGFHHVICLMSQRPSYDPSPVRLAHAVALEDLHGGRWPTNPEHEADRIRAAVAVAHGLVASGQGVVLHCHGGTGRTGTVIGCLLRTLEWDGQQAIAHLDAINKLRGGRWPESPWQAQMVLMFRP
jgi:hypothetical protein